MINEAAIRCGEEFEAPTQGIRLNEVRDDAISSGCRPRKVSGRADVADQIGVGLRNVYDDVLSQPVPDRFFDLLRQLERVGGPQLKKEAP
jgi:hypothetical protein